MIAVRRDETIEQGGIYERNYQTTNDDGTIFPLTGYEARMQVRPSVESTTILLSASTSDGRITINAPSGIVMVSIGADVTAALTFNSGVYDVEVFKTGVPAEVRRLAHGFVSLSKEVTRP